MRGLSILFAIVLVLTGCVNNQGLKPTFNGAPGEPSLTPPPVPALYIRPQRKIKRTLSPRLASMERTLMAMPLAAPKSFSMTYSPEDDSDFLTIRTEGTNIVLAWPTNAWLAGAIPLWKTNIADTNEIWKSVPNVLAHTNADWRTTNGAMFEFRAPIRTNETRFFILSTTFSVHIAWNYDDATVTGFRLYTGLQSRTYNSVTSYTYAATWNDTTNFSAWLQGLSTSNLYHLAATAYLTNEVSGELESDFSEEIQIPVQR